MHVGISSSSRALLFKCWEASSRPPVGTEYVALVNWSSLASAISLLYILAIEAFVLALHNLQSMIYTSVQYCKAPSSLCYLCRSWTVHCVGLRQMLLLLICRVSLWPMLEKTESMPDERDCTQCLLAVHCLLLNSNARLLASVCTLMSKDYSWSPTTNRLSEEHAVISTYVRSSRRLAPQCPAVV